MATQQELAAAYAKKYDNGRTESYAGASVRPITGKTVATIRPPKQSFIGKLSSIVHETADIGGNLVKEAAKFTVNTPKYVVKDIAPLGRAIGTTLSGGYNHEIDAINREREILDQSSAKYAQLYKANKISKDNYKKLLDGLSDSYWELSKRSSSVASRVEKEKNQIPSSAIMTAVDVLSAGKLRLGAVGPRQAVQVAGRDELDALVSQGASSLERAVMNIPNVRANIMRTLEKEGRLVAGETAPHVVKRMGKDIAIGYLLKRPIFYQTNIGQAKDGLNAVMTGDYPAAIRDAAWLGIQMIEGGPLGAVNKGYKWLKDTGQKLTYGKGSFIDELSSRIGDGNRTQLARLVNTAYKQSDEAGKRIEEALRVSQEVSKRVYGDDVVSAADNFMQTYAGVDTGKLSGADLVRDLLNWRNADEAAQTGLKQLVTKGVLTADEAARYTPVRWSAATRDAVATAIEKAGLNADDQWKAVQELSEQPGVGFGNNERLMDFIQNAIYKNAGTTTDAANVIREMDAAVALANGIPKSLQKQLNKLGFVLAEPKGGRLVPHLELEDTGKLISAAKNGRVDVFDPEIVPQPQVRAIADMLGKAGLSPEAASQEGSKKLAESFVANLNDLPSSAMFRYVTKEGHEVAGGQAMLVKLQDYIENKAPSTLGRIITAGHVDKSAIVDMRQLTTAEIREALRAKNFTITHAMAKDIQKAVQQAYIDVPRELRGLGDRAIDYLYKFNPAQKYYSRIQSALRYTYNPFFRLQEGVETSLLSGITGGNRITRYAKTSPALWNKTRAQLDDAVKVLDNAQIFSSSLYGEAAQDQVLGRITANITQGQKRDLAGLALDIAEKRGVDLAQLAAENPEDLDDALRVVVQYGRHGVLASPLARTLNIAFFPMRYNAKVTTLAAQVLAKEPPAVQKAVLHSLFQFSGWLKSDEGIQWQSQHADAIQVLNWITPINSIEYTLQLLSGHVNAPGDLGQLGGLPIGVLTQILDGQGIIQLNTPYVNPQTGDVIPRYIPQTVRSRAAQALTDLIGSTFTYPGRIIGLPGKQQNIRNLVNSLTGTEKGEFKVIDQTDNLTPLEQNMVRVLKGDTSDEALDALYISPAPGQFNGYTLPPLNVLPLLTPRKKLQPRTGLSKSSSSSKKKKNTAVPISQAS